MNKSEKILLISSNFPPVIGGSSVVYDQICRNAAGTVIALGASRDRDTGEPLVGAAEHDQSCGYEIYRIAYLRTPQKFRQPHGFRRWVGLVFVDFPLMCKVLATVTQLLIRNRIRTVCIGELVSLGWLVVPLRYVFRRKVIIYTHGEEIAQESQGFAARLRRFYLSCANGIISVSLFCKSLIVSRFEIDPARIAVIANGVDLKEFFPLPTSEAPSPPLQDSRRVVLAVSRLVERKGLDRLITAISRARTEVPDVHCIIVGEGPLSAALAAQIRDDELDTHVTLAGKVSSAMLAELYRAAEVFALPCRTLPDGDTEGFGLVFLEAGACGKPVVAGAAGGTVEAVTDEETGLVVNGDDPDDIANAVIRILKDSHLASRLGEAGRRRAQHFAWSKAANAFVSFALDRRRAQITARSYPDARENIATLPTAASRLLVTMDVEEGFDWSRFSRTDHAVNGLHQLEAFQAVCQSIGVSPVYLQTYEILDDETFSTWFRRMLAGGAAEAGTHLHAWTTPPFWEEPNVFNSYQCNLPEKLEQRKLETVTRRFTEVLGFPPLIHRAGRWGGSARTAQLLKQSGYRIDLSPSARYSDGRGAGPDFQNIDGRPFWSDAEKALLVVPASSLKFGRGPDWISDLRRRFKSRGADVAEIEGTAIRFSSEGRSLAQLRSMARQFSRRGDPVLVLSLHSSSLFAGGNPYSPTQAAADANLERTRDLLTYCMGALRMRPTTCENLYADAKTGETRSSLERDREIGSRAAAGADIAIRAMG
jgi:glycosyltransferase involved in cell wall biosynthesis